VLVGDVFVEEKLLQKPMTLYQTNEMLLLSHKFSDIVFVVLSNKDEEPARFPAHRVYMAARSRVFENMFYGPDSVQRRGEEELEVEIGDGVSAEAFNILLNYVYTDNIAHVTENNVMSVLYCAKKYELEGLRVDCIKKAKEMVKRDSKKCVLTFLKDSQVLEEQELSDVCLQLISHSSRELLVNNHEEFIYLTQAAVVAICKLDVLSIQEYELFLLISDWAVAEAEREQLDVNSISSSRYVLLNVLPHILFPCMQHDKLAIEIRNSGLLTSEELTDLFAHCLSNGKVETKYSSKPRIIPQIPGLQMHRSSGSHHSPGVTPAVVAPSPQHSHHSLQNSQHNGSQHNGSQHNGSHHQSNHSLGGGHNPEPSPTSGHSPTFQLPSAGHKNSGGSGKGGNGSSHNGSLSRQAARVVAAALHPTTHTTQQQQGSHPRTPSEASLEGEKSRSLESDNPGGPDREGEPNMGRQLLLQQMRDAKALAAQEKGRSRSN